MGTPPAEVDITETLVRRLIDEQCPQFAARSVQLHGQGWDNATYRLDGVSAGRFPRRQLAVSLVLNEQRWLPLLAPRLPVEIPVPLFNGSATSDYPWPWSIVPWIDGDTAEESPIDAGAAASFGRFLADLHQPAPVEAPHNPFRGVPLQERDEAVQSRIGQLMDLDDGARSAETLIRSIWADGVDAAPSTSSTWVHGDLHPRNVLTKSGRLAGVIDWGDVCSGDPAVDLASVWMQFDKEHHQPIRDTYGNQDTDLWLRARAWALSFAVMLINTGLSDDPGFLSMGRRTLSRLTSD